jgi:HD-like signal output (HDOD) protein
MTAWLALAILLTAAVGALLYRRRGLQRGAANDVLRVTAVVTEPNSESHNANRRLIPFQTEATVSLTAAIYSLAFTVPRFDYQILGPHRDVLEAAKDAVADSVNEARYFPRKPALLPKLLHALNSGDASREDIVRLILQDPVLAGNVLKRANSAYYRQQSGAIESIDRAVVLLGNDGLRAPVASAIMQPVFQLPRGFFDQFAPTTWELAQRTAVAAEAYARINGAGDTFVAHLLGLLGGLGRIVLFRMTLDKYRQHNIMPRAEVFIRVMMDHEQQLTLAIARTWELSTAFLAAIDAQRERTLPLQMTPLARTLYYANLCGALTVLCCRDKYAQNDARVLLSEQGLNTESQDAMWTAAAVQER